jgi:hypothetical protein
MCPPCRRLARHRLAVIEEEGSCKQKDSGGTCAFLLDPDSRRQAAVVRSPPCSRPDAEMAALQELIDPYR